MKDLLLAMQANLVDDWAAKTEEMDLRSMLPAKQNLMPWPIISSFAITDLGGWFTYQDTPRTWPASPCSRNCSHPLHSRARANCSFTVPDSERTLSRTRIPRTALRTSHVFRDVRCNAHYTSLISSPTPLSIRVIYPAQTFFLVTEVTELYGAKVITHAQSPDNSISTAPNHAPRCHLREVLESLDTARPCNDVVLLAN